MEGEISPISTGFRSSPFKIQTIHNKTKLLMNKIMNI